MRKICTIVAAAVLLSVSSFAQSYTVSNGYNANNGILFEHSSKTQMNVIGTPSRNAVTLQISNPSPAKYELSLYSSTGRKVTTVLYDHPAGVSTETIYVPELQHGMYYLVAVSANEQRSINILIQ